MKTLCFLVLAYASTCDTGKTERPGTAKEFFRIASAIRPGMVNPASNDRLIE